jgi:tRNA threonylcarbamoyladenosine biosynthesis protein TsaB
VRILAFDTATRATTVALLDEDSGTEIELRDDPAPGARPRHTSQLMALVVAVLDQAGCDWTEIDLLAVGTGPGTFTGLRIGVATARALAQARGLPLVGVSTLESLAAGAAGAAGGARAAGAAGGARDGGHDVTLAVLDARRREVFAAAWSSAALGGPPLLAPVAIAPALLADSAGKLGQRRLAIGDGAIEFRTVLERPGTLIPADDSGLHRVSAVVHCRLAARRPPSRTDTVVPEYLRRPDAELNLPAPS